VETDAGAIRLSVRVAPITKPDDVNLILGQSHFIKTVEDLHEALVGSVPGIQFGLAFCESSGPALMCCQRCGACKRSARSTAPPPTRCR
jgi:adenosine/AMP kinase